MPEFDVTKRSYKGRKFASSVYRVKREGGLSILSSKEAKTHLLTEIFTL